MLQKIYEKMMKTYFIFVLCLFAKYWAKNQIKISFMKIKWKTCRVGRTKLKRNLGSSNDVFTHKNNGFIEIGKQMKK